MMSVTDALIRSQGTAQFGRSNRPFGARVNTLEDAQALVNLFVSYGHDKLDTSRVYGGGTSEEVSMHYDGALRLNVCVRNSVEMLTAPLLQVISQLDLKGCTVDTKLVFFTGGEASRIDVQD